MAKKREPPPTNEELAQLEEESWNAAILHPDPQMRAMSFQYHMAYLQALQYRQFFNKK